jgi:CRP/FNR family transcriptional regulator, cyclic AMP receptor protein
MNYPSEVGQAERPRGDRGGADSRDRIIQALRRSEVFAPLDRQHLAELAEGAALLKVGRRRRIYAPGEGVVGLYVVASGRVRVVRGARDARALTVAYRGPGEVIGEIAITERAAHEDGATATDPVEVVQVPMRKVHEALGRHADLAKRLLQLMVERRLDAEKRIESLLSRSVESRVAEFLLDAAQRHGIPDSRGLLISVKYTHQEIADYVGSTRETVTLTLGDMRRRELVLFDHRRIVVRDLDALSRTCSQRT